MKKMILASFAFTTFSFGQAVVTVEGDITSNTTWISSNVYYLNNQAFVDSGVTLTIEPGTVIKARYGVYSGSNAAPALVIKQGAKIMAEGTKDKPITFKSELEPGSANYGNGRGLWGGIVVNGYAPISTTGGTNNVEGVTGIPYGGNDPDDNSGVMRYVRVWNGGAVIGADNELNGITLAGVGRGTTVEYCEVALNLDDGFEMFGGTVDLRYCVVYAQGDDAFDTDEGYQGRGQFLVSVLANDSDRAHEMDNRTNGDTDSQPRSHPKFANVTVISDSAGHTNDNIKVREGTGGDFRNYVMHGGGGDGWENDDNGTELVTQTFPSSGYPNYLYVSKNNVVNKVKTPFKDSFSDSSFTSITADAGLSITSDTTTGMITSVDLTPKAGGSAFADVDTLGSWFYATDFKGAVGSDNWLKGWTYLDEKGILKDQVEDVYVLEGTITKDTFLPASGNYYLKEQTFVDSGVTLTIEAGATFKARFDATAAFSGSNPAPALVIKQGAKIMAEGTKDKPITFRSEIEPGSANYGNGRGMWGGIVVNGYAPISTTGGTNNVEGLTGIAYGGNDPDDNSGVMRYVRVWNGGAVVGSDNELNGITLAGVGRGTTVEYCEVALNLDDGFEMFGGTVDLKYCVVYAQGDDAFDTDEGYQGRGQFLVSVLANDSDRAHEMDNRTNGDTDSQPRSHPKFMNVTVISDSAGHTNDNIKVREGTGGDFRNYVMYGGGGDGWENDDNGTETVTQTLPTSGYPNYLYISKNNIVYKVKTPFKDASVEAFTSENGDPGYMIESNTSTGFITKVDLTPTPLGPAYSKLDNPFEGASASDSAFFDEVYFKGAVGSDNWLKGWTYLDEMGIIVEQEESLVALGGDITENTTLVNDTEYYLNEQTFVKDGVTLTIEKGTTIYARYGAYGASNPAPALVIERGAKIVAAGTKDEPITFKSELKSDDANYGNGRGLWGGLVVNGRAPISNAGGSANVEGLTGVAYGGSDPNDDSGTLRYVRVWNGGAVIGVDNELNGITLAGVGRGTTVEYCEVALNLDDGFEMFGGTVDLKYCSVIGVGDDAFDTDGGYQGRGQFLFVQRAADSDRAHEMDNRTNGNTDSQPRSHPRFANVTIIGDKANTNDLIKLREGSGGDFRNYILVGGGNDGIENDDNGSELVTQDLAAAEAFGYPNYLYISPNIVMYDVVDPFKDFDQSGETFTETYIDKDPGITYTMGSDGQVAKVNPTPILGGAAYQDVDNVIVDNFFTQVQYKGAFDKNNWLDGWSWLSDTERLETEALSVEEDLVAGIPSSFEIKNNYPNPFNPSTKISFGLPTQSEVKVTIFNVLGEQIMEYNLGNIQPGFRSVTWHGKNMNGAPVPSGMYFYRVNAGTEFKIGKMTLLK